jgi:hypothetical protein
MPHTLVLVGLWPRWALALCLSFSALAGEPNQLIESEKQAGWKLLFDGTTTRGWRGYRQQRFPDKGWVVEQGCLKKEARVPGGDIITEQTFDNFELSWEWRIAPGGNNGVKYLVTEARPSAPGHEYQMVDDQTNADAAKGANRRTASFYHVLPPAPDTPTKPAGQWNRSRIVVRGNQVEHWLNERKVLTYELGSESLKTAIANSKFKETAGFGAKIKGHVMLTDHRDETWFRSLKIRELPAK